MNFVRQSKFRHVFCKPMKREFCIDDVRITKITWDSLFAAANPKFLAVITEGAGGPFMVIPLSKTGKVDKDYPLVDAHKGPCLEVAWCPFNDNVIASCSEDCSAKIWMIPDGGLHKTLKEPLVELLGHQKRVGNILWHPSASNILLTAGADLKILLWNVGTGEALIEIAGHPDIIWSVAFNYNGSKIVTTCKDKKIRVIDPRTGRILQQGMGHEGMKPQRAIFMRNGQIFTTGFTKRSERMYSLRDEDSLDSPIVQEELDTSNGVLVPLYDYDTGLLYLVGKGDSAIRYYEVNIEAPFIHFINIYSTSEPQRGIGFMPKRGLNVSENEIARVYKCTNKGQIEILQFFVPRKSELFQEDLYPDTAGPIPAMSADEWMSGKDADPILMPLKQESTNTDGKPKANLVKKANILAQMPTAQPAPPAEPVSTRLQEPTTPVVMRGASPSATASVPADRSSRSTVDSTSSRYERDYNRADRADPYLSRESVRSDHHESLSTTPAMSRESSVRSDRDASSRKSSRDTVLSPSSGGMSDPVATRSRFDYTQPPTSTPPAAPVVATTVVHTALPSGILSGTLRTSSGQEVSVDELLADVQKLKTVVKRHERRIRFLEEQIHEKDIEFD